ncbi:PQQ-binding-like beta-propeller repeat protein [bacterium]|nr:PQQ-binding-like beta-propeller repeat protein [bacterium]
MKLKKIIVIYLIVFAVSLLAQETAKPPFALLWKYSTTFLQGSIVQPLMDGDTLYFSAGNEVSAIDVNTGETKWKFTLPTGTTVRVTPLLHKDSIIVPASDGKLYIINKQGHQERLLDFGAGGAVTATPIWVEDMLVFPCLDNTLYAINPDAEDPKDIVKWRFRAGDNIPRSPVYGKGLIFFESADIYLYALTPNGEVRWKVPLPSTIISSAPILGQKYVYATAGRSIQFVNPLSGKVVRQVDLPDVITATPLLVGNIIYAGCKDGKLYAIDATTGGRVKNFTPYDAGVSITTSPALYGDYIYFGTANGLLVAIDKSGKLRWQYRMISQATPVYPSPFMPATAAAQLTSQQFAIYATPFWANGYLFALSDDGTLHCFTPQNVDVAPPIVSDIWPEGGPMSGLPVPLKISAKITDEGSGVDSMSIVVKVDGKIISGGTIGGKVVSLYKFDPNTGTLECNYNPGGAPGTPIPAGEHTVTVQVADWFGNVAQKEWKFTIDNTLPPGAGRGTTPTIYYFR